MLRNRTKKMLYGHNILLSTVLFKHASSIAHLTQHIRLSNATFFEPQRPSIVDYTRPGPYMTCVVLSILSKTAVVLSANIKVTDILRCQNV